MNTPNRTLTNLAIYIGVGLSLVGLGLLMAVYNVSNEVAKEFIWTTVSAIVVFGVNIPMFRQFRARRRFWTVCLVLIAIHITIYATLFPRLIGLSVVILGLSLPLESALVYFAFHKTLRPNGFRP